MTLAGYEILAELVHGEVYSVHRGRREPDGAPMLVKSPRRHPARPDQVEALPREYALRKDLRVRGVPRAFDLVCRDGGCWLVLEDPGGVPLPTLLGLGPMALGSFFHLALPLAAILAELHRLELVHQNVQPASLLVHPTTHELWLDGFGLASHEADATAAPAAALTYVSPEQSGRMNRVIDRRTDLYSAGVVFYELLAGARPFRSDDPLELMHAHIAKAKRIRTMRGATRRANT